MRGEFVFRLAAAISMSSLVFIASADTIVRWNFNGDSSTTVPGGPTSPTTELGTGVASLLGAPTGGFNSGVSNGGSSDPVTTSPPNYGWQTTPYAAQGAGSGENGVKFMASTSGFNDIVVRFDTRHSNTSSKWIRLDYTTDGGSTWVLGTAAAGSIFEGLAGDTWYNGRSTDLSASTAADNNPNFGIRLVTIFGPQTGPYIDGFTYTQYWSSNPASTYAATGTLRWDMVTISGSPANQFATLTNVAVDQGLFFGGNLASLTASDDDRLVILCDEIDSNGRAIVTANSPNLAPTTLVATVETRGSRSDLSQFTRLFNSQTSAYQQIDFRSTTLADTTFTQSVPGANYVNGLGDILLQIQWIPQADIDAGDGWTMSIDHVQFGI